MKLSALTAISPIDGRYRSKVENLSNYFSESALIKYRIMVEIEYLIALCELPLPQLMEYQFVDAEALRSVYNTFTHQDAEKVKEIEKTTNHDVKAVEYYIKEKLDGLNFGKIKEFVHFGLTSQDINNTAIPLSYKDALYNDYFPVLDNLLELLNEKVQLWKEIPMLARTHGQPASPTRLGKELYVFVERLYEQKRQLSKIPFNAKFGGATGNFNAHLVAYPTVNWAQFGDAFVSRKLHLKRSQTTTQIEHYDNLASSFDALKRINTILTDLSRDIWSYISMDYFKQKLKDGEIGSSTMPHKVNPIDFENAEGNLGLANALFEHLSAKLPVSRLQRDLTDSTVLRNIGVPIAHTLLAFDSLNKGLNKLIVNKQAIADDLENNWVVVAEGIQTILRREGIANPYELLKELTRTNEKMNQEKFIRFIDHLNIAENIKEELKQISPFNYTGL
ncbi:MAG: adenylosuccinate lyase [Bacteroidetes bacterium]|jgi:adenylosuccinate lyase|nr:adenylosuccinate lyase [Bacteroidota bacterium]